MGKKRKGRECALQILYQVELGGQLNIETSLSTEQEAALDVRPLQNFSAVQLEQLITTFFEHFTASAEIYDHAKSLVAGVHQYIQVIDQTITENSPKWKMSRMPHVDRNILRLCAFELLYKDTPHKVVIDEGIEIAKRFGSDASAKFINGVLDGVANQRQSV